jgi:type IV secretory pathway VirB10-like protein
MDQKSEELGTEIVEEQDSTPKKKGKRLWLYIGFGAALVVIISVGLMMAFRKPQRQVLNPTAEELEQQKYDSEQAKREKLKADQIRDQSFLVRDGDDHQAQLNSLLKDLAMDKNSGLPTPIPDRQAKAEEEAIAHVLRSSSPPAVQPEPVSQPPRRAAQPAQATTVNEVSVNPMFVYSRSFGGAKYVDAPRKQVAAVDHAADFPEKVTKVNTENSKEEEPASEKPVEEKNRLIYTNYPPVTLYEGEMLDAVLVNRIIADTEASPVVCQISKDVFDSSARYVVLPAGSRIVGTSQVVDYKGAHRLFISFRRIILPNGPSIDLPASRKALKALDETGALGVVSKVDRHWFLQFGTAILFGVLDGLSGAAQRGQDVVSTSSVIMSRTSENYERVLENIMSQYSSIVPTIRVDQGKTMKIYLSDDILISPYAKISDRSYYANH